MSDEFEQFIFEDSSEPIVVAPAAPRKVASPLERLQYLIDNTPAIIYTSVPTGDFKMTFVSGNAINVLGFKPEDMVADPNFWFDHIHPDDVPQIFSSLAQLFSEGKRTYEYRFKCHTGEYLWMHDMLKLIRDEEGNPIEVVGSLTDITERKKMETALHDKSAEQQLLIEKLNTAQEQLVQSEKMASVGQLAAGVAHEINNPIGFVNSNMGSMKTYVGTLFGVLGEYDQLVKKFPPDHDITKRFKAISDKADLEFLKSDMEDLVTESMDGLKRVKDIVQSLKDFSHVGETTLLEADIHHGIDSTLNVIVNDIREKATVVKEYGKLPSVKCLISQINQVVMNIIKNGAYAIEGKGTITISTGCESESGSDWVWIKIKDTGVGIPPDVITRIFEPFFTTKPVGTGTGLGLSLSYGIIKKHGGRIDVESTVGVGSCFTIHLPVTPAMQ